MTYRVRGKAWDVLTAIIIFNLAGFILLAFKSSPIDDQALHMAIFTSAVYVISYVIMISLFKQCDKYITLLIFALSSIGFIMLYRLDAQTAIRQVQWFVLGISAFFVILILSRYVRGLDRYFYIYAVVSVALLLLPMLIGTIRGGAKNWIEVGGYTVQPSEFVKLLFILATASMLKEKRSMKELLPLMAFAAICMGILVLENDLGTMVIYFAVFVIMLYVATSNIIYVLGSLIMAGAVGYVAYLTLGHVRTRVEAWLNPWADATDRGYQIVQSLIAIGSGGWLGSGLGLGQPYIIPAAKTDFIFAAIAEEFGILIAVAIIAMYFILIYRGMKIALSANDPFNALIAIGATATLGFQTFVIIGGVIKLIPLTGVTLPFVSYGGSSMVASFMLVGIMQSTVIQPKPSGEVYKKEIIGERYSESY
ncbi:MAG: hypothetical protein PWQ93_1112 [Clostridiales bacterium]|nr:hypothetical protein [Clostridiales bacterium]